MASLWRSCFSSFVSSLFPPAAPALESELEEFGEELLPAKGPASSSRRCLETTPFSASLAAFAPLRFTAPACVFAFCFFRFVFSSMRFALGVTVTELIFSSIAATSWLSGEKIDTSWQKEKLIRHKFGAVQDHAAEMWATPDGMGGFLQTFGLPHHFTPKKHAPDAKDTLLSAKVTP
jgi:hypothetical protein